MSEGNVDMFSKSERTGERFFREAQGVCIDKTIKPPMLYGMTELSIDDAESILQVFSAIASRNTSGTGLNDSSSRSHCFVFLTLYAFDASIERLRMNRFQFIDLAGS